MTRSTVAAIAASLLAVPALAVDLERFDFDDAPGTPLTAAANSVNPSNTWFYDEEATTPNDATTGDVSQVLASGDFQVRTDSDFVTGSLESRFLDIANVSSGQLYLTATLSGWSFLTNSTDEDQLRFTFLDNDTGVSGSTVTAQMQLRRDPSTGMVQLIGDAVGTAGSFDIENRATFTDFRSTPFTMVLALDKDSDSYEVFYKDGSNPSQSLGLGGVSRVRDANSIRMVTAEFGDGNFPTPPPGVFIETIDIDSIVVSDTNPLTDLVTLEVDRVTGAMTLVNTSGSAISGVTGVTIESPIGAYDAASFVNFSGTLAAGQSVALDSAPGSAPGLWVRNPIEDVTATLSASGGDRGLNVDFVGNSGAKWLEGDLNFDGAVDVADYVVLTDNLESDLSLLGFVGGPGGGDLNLDGASDAADFTLFKSAFIDANGSAAFAMMIAGIPEPTSAALVLVAGLPLAVRRRSARSLSQHRLTPQRDSMNAQRLLAPAVLVAMTLTLMAAPVHAQFIEDFQFNDPAGTSYDAAANSANPGNLLSTDTTPADLAGVVTNGAGALDPSAKTNTDFGTTLVDTANLSTGTIFGVMELTWDFQSMLDPTENEEIRLTLISSGTSGVLAEWEIQREDDDTLTILGNTVGATGSGATDISAAPLNGGSLTQSTTFIGVIEADLDADTYAVHYSSDAGATFTTLGTGFTDPARNLDKMRIALNNDLSGDNVLIDRVYLTDTLPFSIEPDLLKLFVHPVSGHVAIVNDSPSEFDIDYYRILSGDDSLEPSAWISLEDRGTDAIDGPDNGSIAGDGIGETWTEAGGSDSGVLSESFLLSSSIVTENEALPLGGVFDLSGSTSALTFEYRDAVTGAVVTGVVEVGELLAGDYNLDGVVDAADYTVWRDNASGLFTPADYTTWVNNFGNTLPVPATAVPEPTSALLVLFSIGCIARSRR